MQWSVAAETWVEMKLVAPDTWMFGAVQKKNPEAVDTGNLMFDEIVGLEVEIFVVCGQ